jgi:hypothetical protein
MIEKTKEHIRLPKICPGAHLVVEGEADLGKVFLQCKYPSRERRLRLSPSEAEELVSALQRAIQAAKCDL